MYFHLKNVQFWKVLVASVSVLQEFPVYFEPLAGYLLYYILNVYLIKMICITISEAHIFKVMVKFKSKIFEPAISCFLIAGKIIYIHIWFKCLFN
jgi:hypothetical protein